MMREAYKARSVLANRAGLGKALPPPIRLKGGKLIRGNAASQEYTWAGSFTLRSVELPT